MPETIPRLVKPLLDEFITTIEQEHPDFVVGLYIHGSLALGEFNPYFSDIDFIAVLNRRCTSHDIERLRCIHQHLQQKYPDYPLSGSYLQRSDLGQFEARIEAHPYYHDKVLQQSGIHDINAVTWWVLKHRGLTLIGTEAQQLDFDVDWDKLITDMHKNLNTYWVQFSRVGKRLWWLLADDGIQWAILGVLRQFYTFNEQDITSKTRAGEYGLQHLPQRWHRIIQEALNIRDRNRKSLYRLRLVRAIEAVRFMKLIIQKCNTVFDQLLLD